MEARSEEPEAGIVRRVRRRSETGLRSLTVAAR
jgi:hypothetical protein